MRRLLGSEIRAPVDKQILQTSSYSLARLLLLILSKSVVISSFEKKPISDSVTGIDLTLASGFGWVHSPREMSSLKTARKYLKSRLLVGVEIDLPAAVSSP